MFDKLCIGVGGQRREETGNRTIPIIGNVWPKVFINPCPSLQPAHNRFYSLVAQLQRGIWSGSAHIGLHWKTLQEMGCEISRTV